MKRSSKTVPFAIIIILAFIIATVIVIKNSYPNLMNVYDVLKITDLKSSDIKQEDDFKDGNIIYDDSIEDNIPSLDYLNNENTINNSEKQENESSINEEIQVDSFEFNKSYIRAVDSELNYDKIEFFTTNTDNDYRVNIKTKISDKPLSGNINVSIYDERGIMLEQKNITPLYYNTINYCDEFNIDFHLEASKKYTLKISADKLEGDYQIAIYELERDAGYSKETALPIILGEEVTANANSTLSDWYALNVEETGRYKILIHNINVGCNINVSMRYEDSSVYSRMVQSETSADGKVFLREGSKVLIEVKPDKDVANGNYIIIIDKETE